MKKLVLLALCLCSAVAFAQDEVTLVVSADGATKNQAIDNALRSAIEQTFGTFVSANTQILNDELVKDEIATVSSGNIQKYTELGSYTLPNGNFSVSLQVTVSINKLVKYAQSKGSECEFAGATLDANLKMLKLKYENSRKAYDNLLTTIKTIGPSMFDYRLTISEPTIGNGKANFEGLIYYDTNQNTRSFSLSVISTLMAISFTEQEKIILRNSGLAGSNPFNEDNSYHWPPLDPTLFYLPTGESSLNEYIQKYCIDAIIITNTGDTVNYTKRSPIWTTPREVLLYMIDYYCSEKVPAKNRGDFYRMYEKYNDFYKYGFAKRENGVGKMNRFGFLDNEEEYYLDNEEEYYCRKGAKKNISKWQKDR